MPEHFSSILSYFCSNERSRGLHCYSIKGDSVLLLPVFFCAGKNRFFNVISNPTNTKKSNRWGLGARRLATYTSHLHQSTNWLAKSESEGWHPTKNIHTWIPLPVFMFEKTFMSKMFVKLCAWFGPQHAKTICKHLRSWVIFSRMKEAVAFIATASKGIGWCCCRCFFLQEKQVLQFKSAKSTVARFSKYPTQSIQWQGPPLFEQNFVKAAGRVHR